MQSRAGGVKRGTGTKGVKRLLLLFMLVALGVIYAVSSTFAEERLGAETGMHLSRLVNTLDAALSRHAYLPVLLANQEEIRTALDSRGKEPFSINRYLEEASYIPEGSRKKASACRNFF